MKDNDYVMADSYPISSGGSSEIPWPVIHVTIKNETSESLEAYFNGNKYGWWPTCLYNDEEDGLWYVEITKPLESNSLSTTNLYLISENLDEGLPFCEITGSNLVLELEGDAESETSYNGIKFAFSGDCIATISKK